MCCGCGGGDGDYFDPMTADVESVTEIMDQADNAADVFFGIVHNPEVLLNVRGLGLFGGGDDEEAEETREE